jgi:hypothetical protein
MSQIFIIAIGNKVRTKLATCLGEDNPTEMGMGSYTDITAPIDGDGIYISSKHADGLNHIDALKEDYPEAKILIGWNNSYWNKKLEDDSDFVETLWLRDDLVLNDQITLFNQITNNMEELQVFPDGAIDPITLDITTPGKLGEDTDSYIIYYK